MSTKLSNLIKQWASELWGYRMMLYDKDGNEIDETHPLPVQQSGSIVALNGWEYKISERHGAVADTQQDITLIEKTIKNTLVQNSGKIPSELATLYCSYILMSIYKIDEIVSRLVYFNKKTSAEADYTMASEKSSAVGVKDTETARERWVIENSTIYREKKDYQYKTYALLNYFEAKQKSLDKIYYLCKSFIGSDS